MTKIIIQINARYANINSQRIPLQPFFINTKSKERDNAVRTRINSKRRVRARGINNYSDPAFFRQLGSTTTTTTLHSTHSNFFQPRALLQGQSSCIHTQHEPRFRCVENHGGIRDCRIKIGLSLSLGSRSSRNSDSHEHKLAFQFGADGGPLSLSFTLLLPRHAALHTRGVVECNFVNSGFFIGGPRLCVYACMCAFESAEPFNPPRGNQFTQRERAPTLLYTGAAASMRANKRLGATRSSEKSTDFTFLSLSLSALDKQCPRLISQVVIKVIVESAEDRVV